MKNLLRRIDDFLLENDAQISAAESFLRSLTYILPGMTKQKSTLNDICIKGRFEDAELASEICKLVVVLVGSNDVDKCTLA